VNSASCVEQERDGRVRIRQRKELGAMVGHHFCLEGRQRMSERKSEFLRRVVRKCRDADDEATLDTMRRSSRVGPLELATP
jgi:hypothetical protein